MTEKRGGSDVGGATDTIAIEEQGNFYKYVYCSIILFVLPSLPVYIFNLAPYSAHFAK